MTFPNPPENTMQKTALILLGFAAALTACDDNKPKTVTTPESSARQDNPMLQYQDKTVRTGCRSRTHPTTAGCRGQTISAIAVH